MNLFASIARRHRAPLGYAEILRVGLPLVAGMCSTTVMEFTDRLFLSHYSVDAIAAVMPATMAWLTMALTLMGICGYASVLVAQYVGSGAERRVGTALWQGIWCALAGGAITLSAALAAEPFFRLVGHESHILAIEVEYFQVLSAGTVFFLLNATVGSFYSGRGITRPVMVANMIAAVVNIPLDYLLIFGGFGIPPLGAFGAAFATATGWVVSLILLSALIFTKKHDERFGVRSDFRPSLEMLRRLLRFGLPGGFNFFVELAAIAWFVFEVGTLGTAPLAASNIAFSINSLVFVPMLGLNTAVSALVGQAMGRGKPEEAATVARNTLHLALAYMAPVGLCIALFADPLISLFAPGDLTPEQFAPVRAAGIILLYYIAIYSVVDAGNIVYFGALKGAGDTPGVLMILCFSGTIFLILPMLALKSLGLAGLHTYWWALTVYVIGLAACVMLRFRRGKWRNIRVVETAPPLGEGEGSEV